MHETPLSLATALADNPREMLRKLQSLDGPFPLFHPEKSADDPITEFAAWLAAAIDSEIREPHAMTLSTVDEQGFPDARVLILKNLDSKGWHFAISAQSPKGRQLTIQPNAALTFYWQKLGRQVRVRGVAMDMGPPTSAADFLARPQGSRAAALMARQSDILNHAADLDAALAQQRQRMTEQPNLVSPFWTVYALRPDQVEFWQADTGRRHTRLKYVRTEGGWSKVLLWP